MPEEPRRPLPAPLPAPQPAPLLAPLLALLMVLLLAAAPAAGSAAGSTAGSAAAPAAASAARTPAAPPAGERVWHSSDGVRGPVAEPVPDAVRQRSARRLLRSYRVVPGVKFTSWVEKDHRGAFRAYLLKADLSRQGLSLQYATPRRVAARKTLTDLLKQDRAIAGINGGFFDIHDTGAPLGVGVDETAVLHGARDRWLTAFVVAGRQRASVQQLPVTAEIPSIPDLHLTNVNTPYVPVHGIGLYTAQWGTAPGYAVTDGAKHRHVRQVVIRDGVVVSNSPEVSAGTPIQGRLLLGRGDGAVALSRLLPVGTEARVRVSVADPPRVAISGSEQLVADGVVLATDDEELHPRTAVGVDADTGKILMLVVDGRSERSRGLTLLELAELMRELGAEEALNLDGGGSTTMVARKPSGAVGVVNDPSDGRQRPVPDGLQLVYRVRR